MRMRRDICLGSLENLIPGSAAHGLPLPDQLSLLRGYGYRGIVAWDHWDAIHGAGLIPCGIARVREARDALPVARLHCEAGLDFTTLHVGTGFETDREMALLAEAVLDAAAITGHRLHVETHRATMTQDIRRTVDLVERFPALRFTLDFSHWYTGHEMTYADEFAERLAWLDPVFRRVDSMQVRIGTSGAIQRPVDPRSAHLADHLAAIERCIAVRRESSDPPDELSIAAELLPARLGTSDAARMIHYADEPESTDRLAEALSLGDLVEKRICERSACKLND